MENFVLTINKGCTFLVSICLNYKYRAGMQILAAKTSISKTYNFVMQKWPIPLRTLRSLELTRYGPALVAIGHACIILLQTDLKRSRFTLQWESCKTICT